MKFSGRTWWLLIGAMMLMAIWGIGDVLRGRSGVEDLILYVPLLISLIALAITLSWSRRRQAGGQVSQSVEPVTAAQRNWRVGKWALATVTLLIGLYTVVWVVRSGSLWMPILVGGITLGVTWSLVVVMLRPKVQR